MQHVHSSVPMLECRIRGDGGQKQVSLQQQNFSLFDNLQRIFIYLYEMTKEKRKYKQ